MSTEPSVANSAGGKLDSRLLAVARGLVILLPICFLFGRVPTDVTVSLVALLFLARSAMTRDWSWTHSGWFRIGMILWLWAMIISAFAVDSSLSYQQAIFWWRFLVFAAALQWWVMDEACMKRILIVATVVATAEAVDTWVQYFTGTDLLGYPRPNPYRLSGPFGTHVRAGSWLLRLIFPVILGSFAWRMWQRSQHMASVSLVVLIMVLGGAILVTGERMVSGLLIVGLVLAVILQKGVVRRAIITGFALVIAVGVTAAITNHKIVNRYVDQTMTIVNDLGESGYGEIWLSALHLVSQRPIIGVGLKNFRVACKDPDLGLPADFGLRCGTHPHNLYLEWLLGSGVIGLALFVCLVTAWLRLLVPAAWHGTTSQWLYGPAIFVFLILWPIRPSTSFFSNWYGGIFYLSLGWALAVVRLSAHRFDAAADKT